MSDPGTFGEAVREARLAKGMSLGQLATSVERSTASVRRWERDEGVPSKGIVDTLAAVLDLSDDDVALIERSPAHRPAPEPVTPEPVTPQPATPEPEAGRPVGPIAEVQRPMTPSPATPPPSTATPPPPPVASQATQAAGSAVTGGVAITEPGPTGLKGWLAELYNPANPWLGYLRAALTVIVLIILAWMLVWALAELSGAVGEIWDETWAEDV
jgi:transcriptional regulator with XRE-family HTH domain